MIEARWIAMGSCLLLAACGNGGTPDTGPGDASHLSFGYPGSPSCSDTARACQSAATIYGVCCTTCPAGSNCGNANPGVDAGNATSVNICSQVCTNAGDCPAPAYGGSVQCVRGLCYQGCDGDAASCPPLEQCVALYGAHFCVVVTCQ